jgi:hypothetical protein
MVVVEVLKWETRGVSLVVNLGARELEEFREGRSFSVVFSWAWNQRSAVKLMTRR